MTGAIVFLGILVPPGLVAVRLAGIQAEGLVRFALALGFGFSLVLPIVLLEVNLGRPWFVLPVVALAIAASRPGPRHLKLLRAMAPDLVVPALLAALAVWVNAGDLSLGPDGASARVGFDVSDRVFYATVAQEVERAPVERIENPVFAGLPLQYSYMPSLAAVLLHRYGGVPVLQAWTTYLPALGLAFTGLAAAALAQVLGASHVSGRALSGLLVALGGDLSFLVRHANEGWLERTRHFFVFYSFSGESLFYNPWTFGVPLMMVSLLWASFYRKTGSAAALVAGALVVAALFETKPFGFVPLWLALACAGLAGRDRRALSLATLSLALAAPALLLTASSGAAREGSPLELAPFAFVEDAVSTNPSLSSLASHAGFAVAALAVLVGGLGVRLAGLPRLARAARPRFELGWLAAVTMGLATLLALAVRGHPTAVDGAQFLVVPQALLWLFVAPVIHDAFRRDARHRLVAALALAMAVVTPLRYVALKRFPERLTSPGSVDRVAFSLSPTTLAACEWLRTHGTPGDRVALPLAGDPEDRGGLKPLYVAAIAGRRVLAQLVSYSIGPESKGRRIASVERLYSTTDPAEGERILTALGATWVWVDAARPLRFASPGLEWRAAFGSTSLLHFTPR